MSFLPHYCHSFQEKPAIFASIHKQKILDWISMKNSRICFQIHKATNKGLEEQTVDKVIDIEDFINKTEEAIRLLIK